MVSRICEQRLVLLQEHTGIYRLFQGHSAYRSHDENSRPYWHKMREVRSRGTIWDAVNLNNIIHALIE